jgi:hypothetical protein
MTPHFVEWFDDTRQRAVHSAVAQQDDLSATLTAVLSDCGRQSKPLALASVGSAGNYGGYSDVIYLCSMITPDSISLLRDQWGGIRIRVLVITGPPGAPESATARATALGIDLSVVDLSDIQRSLGAVIL